jgi:hypothetical protein
MEEEEEAGGGGDSWRRSGSIFAIKLSSFSSSLLT